MRAPTKVTCHWRWQLSISLQILLYFLVPWTDWNRSITAKTAQPKKETKEKYSDKQEYQKSKLEKQNFEE